MPKCDRWATHLQHSASFLIRPKRTQMALIKGSTCWIVVLLDCWIAGWMSARGRTISHVLDTELGQPLMEFTWQIFEDPAEIFIFLWNYETVRLDLLLFNNWFYYFLFALYTVCALTNTVGNRLWWATDKRRHMWLELPLMGVKIGLPNRRRPIW